jgi:hypothetical protein
MSLKKKPLIQDVKSSTRVLLATLFPCEVMMREVFMIYLLLDALNAESSNCNCGALAHHDAVTQITGCYEGAGGQGCDPELCRNSAVIEIKIWQSLWGPGCSAVETLPLPPGHGLG